MRAYLTWVLALALPTVCVAVEVPAEAIVPDGTTIQLLLLRQKSIQQELKIDAELAKKISEFTDKEADAFKRAFKLGDAERQSKFEDLEKENKKFLEDNFSAEQRKRLEQIAMQVTGLQQLARPEVVKFLSLTEEQQTKFKEYRVKARIELAEVVKLKNSDDKNAKLAKLRAAVDKFIEETLTEEQKTKGKELVGEWFKGELVFEESE